MRLPIFLLLCCCLPFPASAQETFTTPGDHTYTIARTGSLTLRGADGGGVTTIPATGGDGATAAGSFGGGAGRNGEVALSGFAVLSCVATVYVDAAATGADSGVSWGDAFLKLQDALTQARTCAGTTTAIHVAQGVYYPDEGVGLTDGDRGAAFALISGVTLEGGYPTGGGPRDWRANRTILSGDIDGNDTNTDGNFVAESTAHLQGSNSYHVVTGNSLTSATVLDGFTITAGLANGSGNAGYGGGFYNDGSGSDNESSPTIRNVSFYGNSARYGGAMYNSGNSFGRSSPVFTNTTFYGNSASDRGGAVYNSGSLRGTSSPVFTNTTFYSNSAGDDGGAVFSSGGGGTSSPVFTNTTFYGNSASDRGGAVFNDGTSGTSSPVFTNTILWGNTASSGSQIYNAAASPTLHYSLIEGDCPGTGIFNDNSTTTCGTGLLSSDPRFADASDPDGPDGVFGTDDDGLHLASGSPALDAGDNTALPPALTTDLAGNPRLVDNGSGTATVDLGAYEAPPSVVLPVELVSFTATVDGETVHLTWATASETNNAGFSVETVQATAQQATALQWHELAFIEGHGTTTEAQAYAFAVTNLAAGTHRFRLKQVDYDGRFEYSPEVEALVEAPRVLALEGTWPNPVRDQARIRFTVPSSGQARLVVYDVLGREVAVVFDAEAAAGAVHEVVVDASSLASGTYLAVLAHQGRRTTRPFVVSK